MFATKIDKNLHRVTTHLGKVLSPGSASWFQHGVLEYAKSAMFGIS